MQNALTLTLDYHGTFTAPDLIRLRDVESLPRERLIREVSEVYAGIDLPWGDPADEDYWRHHATSALAVILCDTAYRDHSPLSTEESLALRRAQDPLNS